MPNHQLTTIPIIITSQTRINSVKFVCYFTAESAPKLPQTDETHVSFELQQLNIIRTF